MEHLFKHRDSLKKKINAKFVFLFLDYDGTLTPIVETPEKAIIPDEIKELLKKLSKSPNCKLSIISGRALKDIKRMVGIDGIIYAGNHGLEIEGPKIKFESLISPRNRVILAQIKEELTKKLSVIKGALLEDKGFTLSVHFRLVNKEQIPKVKAIVHEATILYLLKHRIKLKPGKMVLEIRPPVEWDKGKVVLWLLARQRFALKEKGFLPIYIGDDKTDEDAFRAIENKGLTIFVGEPKASYAKYYLKDTGEVFEFLQKILVLLNARNVC